MNDDSRGAVISMQGKKAYRLKITSARVKPVQQIQPNYWEENEIQETIRWHKNK